MTLARVSREDRAIDARVVARRPLRYDAGPDVALDRPAHVRAGSGLAWASSPGGPRLVVAQDDASFLAVLDPASGNVGSITLDYAPGGARQFDTKRGNKKHKLDLEACCAVRRGGREILLAFGSGSLPIRERLVVLEHDRARVVPASQLYAALRADRAFSGSELNIEGAAVLGDRLILFQRGNGAPHGAFRPVDATCELPLDPLLAWLDDPRAPLPMHERVTQWELGTVRGVRLTFTDACAYASGVSFLAAAEASPDAIEDGEVVGVAIGWIPPAGEARHALVREGGEPFLGKCEGLAWRDERRAYVVVDRDDPDLPSELLELEIDGIAGPA